MTHTWPAIALYRRLPNPGSPALVARNEELICELTSTILSASRYSARATVADEENGRLKAANKELRHTVIRAKAEPGLLRKSPSGDYRPNRY